jgi:hypothetical protein
MRRLTEGLVLLGSLILAVKWAFNPSGPYEPFIALTGIALAVLDFLFGKRSSDAAPSSEKSVLPKVLLQEVPQPKNTTAATELPPYTCLTDRMR